MLTNENPTIPSTIDFNMSKTDVKQIEDNTVKNLKERRSVKSIIHNIIKQVEKKERKVLKTPIRPIIEKTDENLDDIKTNQKQKDTKPDGVCFLANREIVKEPSKTVSVSQHGMNLVDKSFDR